MLSSTEVQKTRRELVACGVHDPFELLAQALQRNQELQAEVEMLQRIVNRR